jgi:hypothetical protein
MDHLALALVRPFARRSDVVRYLATTDDRRIESIQARECLDPLNPSLAHYTIENENLCTYKMKIYHSTQVNVSYNTNDNDLVRTTRAFRPPVASSTRSRAPNEGCLP